MIRVGTFGFLTNFQPVTFNSVMTNLTAWHPRNEGKVSHETEYDSNMIPRHSLVIDWTKRVKTLSEAFEPLNKPSFSSLAMPPWRPTTTSQCADKLYK